MALNWKWENKIGEATMDVTGGKYTLSLYTGNADIIWLYEYEENGEKMYSLYSFWDDETHAKKCLGLTKGYDNNALGMVKFRINKAFPKALKYVGLVAKAFDDITIEIYTDKGESGKE